MARHRPRILLAAALLLTALVYWPGLYGSWLFDDYPNIVENKGVQPTDASLPSLVNAALSSPSSEFKRPLASLSFAANYLLAGRLDPFSMKLTNLVIHLLNGLLVYLLARGLIGLAARPPRRGGTDDPWPQRDRDRIGLLAALIAAGWLLLPINLTGVLYVVQRMESMANLFVLAGLIGYVAGRRRMLESDRRGGYWAGFALCAASVVLGTGCGALAKETAVMLPLYAALIEWSLLRCRHADRCVDGCVAGLFGIVLALPLAIGLAWQLPKVVAAGDWATRNFDLHTRLLTETRVVTDYVAWTLLPTPHALSFYHDDYTVSTGWLHPWTTLGSAVFLLALVVFAVWIRPRRPLLALGIVLFLGCQLLTGTILPLELVYEHRNYFASFGLMLAVVPILAAPFHRLGGSATTSASRAVHPSAAWIARAALLVLFAWWSGLTAMTAWGWGDQLRLAQMLAERAPDSPRAQYELGRTYIIYSKNDPASPYTRLAYAPLERAARFPGSSILPEQALIFMNARMGLPLKNAWWDSMIAKLKSRPTGVQDDSSLQVLVECARDGDCKLPQARMVAALQAALAHPHPSSRVLAVYGDYAWNVLDDHDLGLRMIERTVASDPGEPAYRITLVRMLLASGHVNQARVALRALERLNIGGRLDSTLDPLRKRFPAQGGSASPAPHH